MNVATFVQQVVDKHIDGARLVGDGEFAAPCPFHQDSSPSFFINRKTGLWICHAGCGSGSLPYLLRKLGYGRGQVDKALAPIADDLKSKKEARPRLRSPLNPFIAAHPLPEAHLGAYDVKQPVEELVRKGFDPTILTDYDVGFDRVNKRITFPVRDLYGNLSGISGRATLRGQKPKYKFYASELEEVYPGYTFERQRHLWNADRIYPTLYFADAPEEEEILVVEGFKACLWLLQCGFSNAVATLGSSLSRTQAALLHRMGCRITLFMDNDRPGREKTQHALKQLWGAISDIREVEYPYDAFAQPDDFDEEELQELIENAVPIIPRRRRD